MRCGARDFTTSPDTVTCRGCGHRLAVENGVLQVRAEAEDAAVTRERAAVATIDRAAVRTRPTDYTFDDLLSARGALRDALFSLPYDNGGEHFREQTYFRNVAKFAGAFDFVAAHLGCAPGARVLDVGADMTWSTSRLAERGWRAVGIDINHHLELARVLGTRAPYGVVNVDMHVPAFADGVFDGVTAFNALHHTHRLPALVGNLARCLRPGGRLGFVEAYWYYPQARADFGVDEIASGINENVYRLEEWHQALVQAGFELVTFVAAHSVNAIYEKRPPGAPARTLTLEAARDELFDTYYHVSFTAPEVVGPVAAGGTLDVPIVVHNRSRAGWSSGSQIPTFASYHLYAGAGAARTLASFDNVRTTLPADVLSQTDAPIALRVEAPSAPGDYTVEVDLVHEGITWFADRGGRTATVRLAVR